MKQLDRAALLRMAPAALLAHVIDETIARKAQPEPGRETVLRMMASGYAADTSRLADDEAPF